MKPISEIPMGAAPFPHGAGDESNPNWQDAPYEESGIVLADSLADNIAHFLKRFDAVSIRIERDTEHPGLFKYHLREESPSTTVPK